MGPQAGGELHVREKKGLALGGELPGLLGQGSCGIPLQGRVRVARRRRRRRERQYSVQVMGRLSMGGWDTWWGNVVGGVVGG